MQAANQPVDYVKAIAALARKLPSERAAQLYDFARFLLVESSDNAELASTPAASTSIEEDWDQITADELTEEDAVWAATLERHAKTFAELKAQAKTEVQEERTTPMFDPNGDFGQQLKG